MDLTPEYEFWNNLSYTNLGFHPETGSYRLTVTPIVEQLTSPPMKLIKIYRNSMDPVIVLDFEFNLNYPSFYEEICQLDHALLDIVSENSVNIFNADIPRHKLEHLYKSMILPPTRLSTVPRLRLTIDTTCQLVPVLETGDWIVLSGSFSHLCLQQVKFFLLIEDLHFEVRESESILGESKSKLLQVDSEFA